MPCTSRKSTCYKRTSPCTRLNWAKETSVVWLRLAVAVENLSRKNAEFTVFSASQSVGRFESVLVRYGVVCNGSSSTRVWRTRLPHELRSSESCFRCSSRSHLRGREYCHVLTDSQVYMNDHFLLSVERPLFQFVNFCCFFKDIWWRVLQTQLVASLWRGQSSISPRNRKRRNSTAPKISATLPNWAELASDELTGRKHW